MAHHGLDAGFNIAMEQKSSVRVNLHTGVHILVQVDTSVQIAMHMDAGVHKGERGIQIVTTNFRNGWKHVSLLPEVGL